MSKRISAWVFVFTILLSAISGGLVGCIVTMAKVDRPKTSITGERVAHASSLKETADIDNKEKTEEYVSAELPKTQTGNEMTVVEVAQKCTPSVVNITVKEKVKEYTGGSTYTETVTSHGTGVIVRKDGYIVTCHHVVEGADSIYVTLNDSTEHKAKMIGFDERFDLAVIRVDALSMPAAELGDSECMNAGETVVVIGNPLGEFGSSVSVGVLSAPAREITIANTPLRLMQTDAAVNPGNSGGGLFNCQGQLIGIVNAKISASGIEGIGFAIPLNTIKANVESIIASGKTIKKAVLGISTKTAACFIGGKSVECLEIASVRSDSAAMKSGLCVGDYLLSVDGKELKTNDDLTLAIKYHSAGDVVQFKVQRNKQTRSIKVTLGEG